MRSDHLGDCGHYEGFAELVNATQYLLPRIRDDALLRAIREPARLFGGEVAADLAVRLVDESRAEIDALPLVQHALMRLWRQAGGAVDQAPRPRSNPDAPHPVLTAEAYSGLEPLLSEHAEEVLAEVEAAHPGSAKVTEYLFRALTEIDAEGRGIRRPRRLSELVGATGGDQAALERVVERFARPDCGFLVRSSDNDPVIDLGHEALIRCWNKLDDPTLDPKTGRARGWLQRERDDERTWRAMLVQAEAGDRISPATLKSRDLVRFPARARLGRALWRRLGPDQEAPDFEPSRGEEPLVGRIGVARAGAAPGRRVQLVDGRGDARDGVMMLGLRVGLGEARAGDDRAAGNGRAVHDGLKRG